MKQSNTTDAQGYPTHEATPGASTRPNLPAGYGGPTTYQHGGVVGSEPHTDARYDDPERVSLIDALDCVITHWCDEYDDGRYFDHFDNFDADDLTYLAGVRAALR